MRDPLLPDTPLEGPPDLTNCDREPVHAPGGVQAHGGLIAVSRFDGTVVAASQNCDELTGCGAPRQLVGRTFRSVLPELAEMVDRLAKVKEGQRADRRDWQGPGGQMIVTAHHCDDVGLLEFEPAEAKADTIPDGSDLVGRLFTEIAGQPLQAVYDTVVQRIREFSGFDRVMLYRFHEDAHGSVVAEARRDDQEPFLGLHYPAGDIPVPARRLYELNWIRTIADVNSAGVPLHPLVDPDSGRPLNLSFAALRAISPIHLEYLRNMRVAASMSISVMNGQQLWGLIACHHNSPRIVSPGMRDACELAGSLLSVYLTSRQQQELLSQQVAVSEALTSQLAVLAGYEELGDGVERVAATLTALFDAEGMVWQSGDQRFCWGEVPADAAISDLIQALAARSEEAVVWTDEISRWLPAAERYADRCAGLLSIRLGQRQGSRLMFFRQPFARTITWAGDPGKSSTDESGRLTPRKSFAAYRQEVAHRSRPWTAANREAARSLAAGLQTIVVERSARLERLNEELRQLNFDLDAFAYAASHDLREPLRGMLHFTSMLERARDLADDNFAAGLDGLKRIVARMSELLDGLLRFSRVGRADLKIETFTLDEVVAQMKDVVFAGQQPANVEIQVRQSAELQGDFACVREVLGNLVSNAVKYNDSDSRVVEIGAVPVSRTPLAARFSERTQAVYVSDNGIGIAPQHFERIFDIFQRLHDRDRYGGGSGAGLTIVRRIIDRHGGAIAPESGAHGTTFYFTLGNVE